MHFKMSISNCFIVPHLTIRNNRKGTKLIEPTPPLSGCQEVFTNYFWLIDIDKKLLSRARNIMEAPWCVNAEVPQDVGVVVVYDGGDESWPRSLQELAVFFRYALLEKSQFGRNSGKLSCPLQIMKAL